MNYKQKYKQSLERAKKLYEQGTITESLGFVFPELIEIESEKIREEIIAFLRSKNGYMTPNEDWDFHNRWLAWLEKQGKKLDAAKVIEWISENIPIYGNYVMIDRFKKDFDL